MYMQTLNLKEYLCEERKREIGIWIVCKCNGSCLIRPAPILISLFFPFHCISFSSSSNLKVYKHIDCMHALSIHILVGVFRAQQHFNLR